MKEANKVSKAQGQLSHEDSSVVDACEDNCREGNLIVVTGPSGVGKGTMTHELLKTTERILKSVSVTTRKKRDGERDGIDYFFRTRSQFVQMRDNDEFLEWADFTGNYYGTPKQWVFDKLKDGFDVLLEIEVKGARQVRDKEMGAILIFIVPPSIEELERRLRSRGSDSQQSIKSRLKKAKEELKQRDLFDHEVINDNLTQSVHKLRDIVYAERSKAKEREA